MLSRHRRPLVTVAQRLLPEYRAAFFEQLHDRLLEDDVDFELLVGASEPGIGPGLLQASWVKRMPERPISIGGRRASWQPGVLAAAQRSDLVIVEQAARLLANYPLALRRALDGSTRLAFWGHGFNHQATPSHTTVERVKRYSLLVGDWWFAYTADVAAYVAQAGFPKDRITDVRNTIDISDLLRLPIRRPDRFAPRGLFLGSLYEEKRIPFLLECAEIIAEGLPGFRLRIAGHGPAQRLVQDAATRLPWLDFLGPVHGDRKARLLADSDLILMPGLVGLVAVDSLASGTPLLTTAAARHSPEIIYVRDGVNGVIMPDMPTPRAYAQKAMDLLSNEAKLLELSAAGRCTAERELQLEGMTTRFAAGVLAALARPGRRPLRRG